MADYGLAVTNDSGSVIISSEYKLLVFSERGTFRITSSNTDTPGYGSATFLKPVLSIEPPQIFVRYASGPSSNISIYIRVIGSAGNWTGFRVVAGAGGSVLKNDLIDFVVCKFSDRVSTDTYGMQLWDAAGNPIYTSSDTPVKYSRFTSTWSVRPVGDGTVLDIYRSGLTIESDDFISITSIDRGYNWFTRQYIFVSLSILASNVRTCNILVQHDNRNGEWLYQGTRGTKASIPICKFPIEQYYNT